MPRRARRIGRETTRGSRQGDRRGDRLERTDWRRRDAPICGALRRHRRIRPQSARASTAGVRLHARRDHVRRQRARRTAHAS